jgi:arginase family enzyme
MFVDMFIDERAKIHLFVRNKQVMQLTDYLHPIPTDVYQQPGNSSPRSLINVIELHTLKMPSLEGAHIAILGVQESRFHEQSGTAKSPDAIRKEFYKLVQPKYDLKIVDLGNITAGNSMNDTLFALNEVLHFLLKQKIVVIILGGSADNAYAQYTAYQNINRSMQVVCTDCDIELLANDTQPEQSSYLNKIVSHQPAYLFNVSHFGAQQYFIEQESIDAFERMNFDIMRLGYLQQNLQQTEPVLRNADMLIMNLNALRASDAPASNAGNPNGLYGEQTCQLMRYAGMSNELSSVGIYEYDVTKDIDGRTAKLCAQMAWYFIDGFYNRMFDYPVEGNTDYAIYRILLHNNSYEIVFFKHLNTDRWWMEVPYPNERSKHTGKYMVPCSYTDYQAALNDDIPDRWMKAYQKLMI